jgi:hypothetical protein
MNEPTIPTTINDTDTNVRWTVMAYRKLSEQEAANAVKMYLSSIKPNEHPTSGEMTITSVIGLLPGL